VAARVAWWWPGRSDGHVGNRRDGLLDGRCLASYGLLAMFAGLAMAIFVAFRQQLQ